MKQVLQDLQTGATEVVEAPAPGVRGTNVLINTSLSLVSAGTERMLVDFGKANLLDKIRQQPDKVRMVLEKIQTDGLLPTVEAVRAKLQQPLALGYSNVGVVVEMGSQVEGLKPGDRVVSNGPHADVVRVPRNLCAKIPDRVDNESAAFTVLGSIALQGIRLAQPTIGESVAVTGVGLIGLLAVQLLKAQGCRVLAIDLDEDKLALAKEFGAETCNARLEDPVVAGLAFSHGQGLDAVIIAASTSSSDPVSHAARMSRKRGRIVLVGVTGLELNRADFYEKELTFQVSCSYGPGRYDPTYEQKGRDYPIGFVRWTEQRNFEAVLDLMASGKLNVKPLVSHRFAQDDAPLAYETLLGEKTALGILLDYDSLPEQRLARQVNLFPAKALSPAEPVLGVVGAGNYASRILIPAFVHARAQLHTLVSTGGVNGVVHGRTAGFREASSDLESTLADQAITCIAIATRHDSHSDLVIKSLEANKHVFVEKPLCLTLEQLKDIEQVCAASGKLLMVGFNRRFAPQVQRIKSLLQKSSEPRSFIMTVNAGSIPRDHWTQDKEVGGGRIIGEACHFIDLLRFLAGQQIIEYDIHYMNSVTQDTASISLRFADGSIGTVHYVANGSRAFPKERLEVFAGGKVLQLDNFRRLRGYGWKGFTKMNLWRQDKGQKACVAAFLHAVKNGRPSPIPLDEILEVSRISIELASGRGTALVDQSAG